MKGIVVTFDRLALRCLGCYGNASVSTPNFDRLAARGVVFDRHYTTDVGQPGLREFWVTGRSRYSESSLPAMMTLPQRLHQQGIPSTLLVEQGTRFPSADFPAMRAIAGRDGLTMDSHETPFARLVTAALDALAEANREGTPDWLLWLASRGVPSPWLPPLEWAMRFLELEDDSEEIERAFDADDLDLESEAAGPEELPDLDPETFEQLLRELAALGRDGSPPEDSVAAELPPNVQWRLSRAIYSGYVALLDAQLGRLLDAIDEFTSASDDIFVIVTAAEGEMLGEPSALTGTLAHLAASQVHTPLIAWRGGPGGEPSGGYRTQRLVQTIDLCPTIADFFRLEDWGEGDVCEGITWRGELERENFEEIFERDFLVLRSEIPGRMGILSPDYYLVVEPATPISESQTPGGQIFTDEGPAGARTWRELLFQKPEDAWDVNDVRRSAVEDEISALRAQPLQIYMGGR